MTDATKTALSRDSVDRVIGEIKKELAGYAIDGKYLAKFTDAPYDREVLGYIAGEGGAYLKFLSLLVRKLEPKNILELGNYGGASTLCIYAGMPLQSRFTTVDLVRDQRYCPDEMFKDARMNFVFGDVCDLSVYGDRVPMDVDLLFEDTIHRYRQTKDIFDIYENLLADRALVAIDDINVNDMRKFFDEIPHPKWDLTDICHYSGWGLVLFERKQPRSREDRLRAAYKISAAVWKRRHDECAAVIKKIEAGKPGNALRRFVHGRKNLHQAILAAKRNLGLIPQKAEGFDEKRFYSKNGKN